MKKIVNFLFLMVICLLPVVVSAEEKYELDWSIDNRAFLYEENDIYYFTDYETIDSGSGMLYSYDVDGNLLNEEIFFDTSKTTLQEIMLTKKYKELIPYFNYTDSYGDYFYSEELNSFVDVFYCDEEFGYFDEVTGEDIYYEFSDDVDFTKDVLGKRYDIYNKVKNLDVDIFRIDIFDNISVAYYKDDNYYTNAYIYDSEYNLIIEYKSNNIVANIFEQNGIFYIVDDNRELVAYRLDGTVIERLTIQSEWFDDRYFGSCDDITFNKAYINDSKLFITFRWFDICPRRMAWNDASDYVKGDIGPPQVFTLVYDLNYKVEAIGSSNGEFTYETKVDEDGRSYVELKVTPKDGYSVEKIIVTDVNGNEIEVTNNKFFMPMTDVKVEVKYVLGEYLPIPDTLLNVNIWSISFGIIIIVFGITSIVKTMSEDKIKE